MSTLTPWTIWSASALNWTGSAATASPGRNPTQAWAAIERAVIGKAVNLLSGPGGLASFLAAASSAPARRSEPAAGHRLFRDHPGRDPQRGHPARPALPVPRLSPARSVCQVHHVKHKKNGGETSITNCVLLCRFHHLIVLHKWDWSLVLNRDGTTTAWNKDRTRSSTARAPGPPWVTTPGRQPRLRLPMLREPLRGSSPSLLHLAHVRGRVLVHDGDPGEVPRFVGGEGDRELMAALQPASRGSPSVPRALPRPCGRCWPGSLLPPRRTIRRTHLMACDVSDRVLISLWSWIASSVSPSTPAARCAASPTCSRAG